jgi:hypothetical protein
MRNIIDLALPPYNVNPDWTGSDTAASNWTNAFDDACAELSQTLGSGTTLDTSTGVGGTITCSKKGVIMLDAGRVLPIGVGFVGMSKYSNVLKCRNASDPTKHFISLGDPTTGLACMGSRIKNVNLYSDLITAETPNKCAMLFSNNAQDTEDMMSHLIIFGGSRAGVWYETAYGGATSVDCHDVTALTNGTKNPAFHFDGTDATSFRLDLLEPIGEHDETTQRGIEGSVGLELGSGLFEVSRLHAEWEHIAAVCKIALGGADFRHCVGNQSNPYMFVIEAPTQPGSISFERISLNGSMVALVNTINNTTLASNIKQKVWV